LTVPGVTFDLRFEQIADYRHWDIYAAVFNL
jgi:hypothetical protein